MRPTATPNLSPSPRSEWATISADDLPALRAQLRHLAGPATSPAGPRLQWNEQPAGPDGSVKVRIHAPPAALGDWELVALATHHSRGHTETELLPGPRAPGRIIASDRLGIPACEHCRTTRRRRHTYLLAGPAGQLVQVGSGCLRDFTSHDDRPARRQAKVVTAALGHLDAAARPSAPVVPAVDYLAHVAAAIRTDTFTPASQHTPRRPATHQVALDRLQSPGQDDDGFQVAHQDWDRAGTVIHWARHDLASRPNLEDYHRRLAAVLAQPQLDPADCPLAASSLVAHGRDRDRDRAGRERRKRAVHRRRLGHLADVGERVKVRVQVQRVSPVRQPGPPTYAHVLTDPDGRELRWFARQQLAAGSTHALVGRVCRHDTHRGLPVTVLDRCRTLSDGE